jgi:hypothetical protein
VAGVKEALAIEKRLLANSLWKYPDYLKEASIFSGFYVSQAH